MAVRTLSRTESSNTVNGMNGPETQTKTNTNYTQKKITPNTENYDSTLFEVSQITHGDTTEQSSTVTAITAVPSASHNCIILVVAIIMGIVTSVVVVILVWFKCRRKCKYRRVPTDPQGEP
jgi:hypothetical protein